MDTSEPEDIDSHFVDSSEGENTDPADGERDGGKTYSSARVASSSERRGLSHLWLISYADFMTILMIFFLGMYGYTVLAKASLIKLQAQNKLTEEQFAQVLDKLKNQMNGQLEIKKEINKIVLQLPSEILFASGEAKLAPQASRTLEEFGKSLMLMDGDVVVEGHTDNVPIKGGIYKSNWELSAARAFSVVEVITKNGVPPERVAAWGFGENRPQIDNMTEANRAKNRRIEIVLLRAESEKVN